MTLVFKKSRFIIVYYIGLYLIYGTVFFYSLVILNKDNDYFDMGVNSFYKVELLFTALSFTHPFQQAGMHESQVKFRTISSREKIVYKKLIISIKKTR